MGNVIQRYKKIKDGEAGIEDKQEELLENEIESFSMV